MPKGGHAASGPPPDPNALRRDRPIDQAGWTKLPAEGRKGRAPKWPHEAKPTDREADIWSRIWRTPHAVVWERLGWYDEVAMYVRCLARAERGTMTAAVEMRQWSDRLGLNPAAMLRNRWRISDDEVGARRSTAARSRPSSRSSARSRLKVVSDGLAPESE